MIPATLEEQKKEAFRLFEDGRYQESLNLCMLVLGSVKDQPLEVLAATNLFYTGKLDDAEVYFRDLAQKMPDSSYVHSYLAKGDRRVCNGRPPRPEKPGRPAELCRIPALAP
jgi:predicted Zn-dependent protease